MQWILRAKSEESHRRRTLTRGGFLLLKDFKDLNKPVIAFARLDEASKVLDRFNLAQTANISENIETFKKIYKTPN